MGAFIIWSIPVFVGLVKSRLTGENRCPEFSYVFEMTGFRLGFIPMKFGAGMKIVKVFRLFTRPSLWQT